MTVYLDMDGVIADFFGAVEKLYGVDHWKSIKHRDGIFVELRNTDFFNTLPFDTASLSFCCLSLAAS